MTLLRALNTLRRDAANMALHSLGLKRSSSRNKNAGNPANLSRSNPRRTISPVVAGLMPYPMKVIGVARETTDAVSLTLARQDGLPIDFKPGMFFTLVLNINNQEYRRAYSISSASHLNTTATVTIKRVAGGTVSNWINDNVHANDTLRVLGPSGSFVVPTNPTSTRHLLLVGGGSGITPLMSITRSVLTLAPQSQIHLFYGNRGVDDIIFREALDQLMHEHHDRLVVTHVLEKSPQDWSGMTGRLDRQTFAALLDLLQEKTSMNLLEVYTCGPEPMMNGVEAELLARGFPRQRFHQEKFTPSITAADAARFGPQEIEIRYEGQSWVTKSNVGQTLLEAGLAGGAPMQFSCALGGCGRCRVKIIEGKADMPEPNCLMPDEKAQGFALACIAHACSRVTLEIDPPKT